MVGPPTGFFVPASLENPKRKETEFWFWKRRPLNGRKIVKEATMLRIAMLDEGFLTPVGVDLQPLFKKIAKMLSPRPEQTPPWGNLAFEKAHNGPQATIAPGLRG